MSTKKEKSPISKSLILFIFFGIVLFSYLSYQFGQSSMLPALNEASNKNNELSYVSYTTINDKAYLRFKGKIYEPLDFLASEPTVVDIPNNSQYEWKNIQGFYTNLKNTIEIFDFKRFPSSNKFLFTTVGTTMLYPEQNFNGREYNVFYFDGKEVRHIIISSWNSTSRYGVPKVSSISGDGKYITLSMFGCWGCGGHEPEKRVYDLEERRFIE